MASAAVGLGGCAGPAFLRGVNASFLYFECWGVEIDVLLEHSGNKTDASQGEKNNFVFLSS